MQRWNFHMKIEMWIYDKNNKQKIRSNNEKEWYTLIQVVFFLCFWDLIRALYFLSNFLRILWTQCICVVLLHNVCAALIYFHNIVTIFHAKEERNHKWNEKHTKSNTENVEKLFRFQWDDVVLEFSIHLYSMIWKQHDDDVCLRFSIYMHF